MARTTRIEEPALVQEAAWGKAKLKLAVDTSVEETFNTRMLPGNTIKLPRGITVNSYNGLANTISQLRGAT